MRTLYLILLIVFVSSLQAQDVKEFKKLLKKDKREAVNLVENFIVNKTGDYALHEYMNILVMTDRFLEDTSGSDYNDFRYMKKLRGIVKGEIGVYLYNKECYKRSVKYFCSGVLDLLYDIDTDDYVKYCRYAGYTFIKVQDYTNAELFLYECIIYEDKKAVEIYNKYNLIKYKRFNDDKYDRANYGTGIRST